MQMFPAKVESECWDQVRQRIQNGDQHTLLPLCCSPPPLFVSRVVDGSEFTALSLCISEEFSLLHNTDTKAALLPPEDCDYEEEELRPGH